MDAHAPDLPGIDRRHSVTRLAASLRPLLPGGLQDALVLPLCFLFARHLRFDAADPLWADRDRLVLDAGLAPLGAALAGLAGLPDAAFRSPCPVFGVGAGLALAERLLAARFGRSLVDHRCWVVASAEELAAGPAQEAAWLAGTWRLARLTAMVGVAAADSPGLAGFAAAGWSVRRIDAGAAGEVASAISAALRSQRPTLIACIAPASPCHSATDAGDFWSAAESAEAWRGCGKRSAGVRRAWLKRLARHGSRTDFDTATSGKLPHGWYCAFFEPGPLLPPGQETVSTSWTLRRAIIRLGTALPELVRLPADAATRQPGALADPLGARDPAACLAQGVSCAAAGLALHGGVVPVSKHKLDEVDAVSSGLRAAATSALRFVTLLIEPAMPCRAGGQRAGLRAMRNLAVFRPADASEALECAELALRRNTGPSVILASETPVPLLADRPSRTRCAKGGYVVAEAAGPRAATLIASGPELHLALAAQRILAAQGWLVAVVSLPSWTLFARQEPAWHAAVLGDALRVGIEAGGGFGWDRWLGPDGFFIGPEQMDGVSWTPALPGAAANRIADLVLRRLGLRQLV